MARVLVVDDRIDIGSLCARLLNSSGHDADAAGSGEEALRKIEQRSPDLVLLDLSMPGMDGFEVLEALKSRTPAPPPVVILSAQDDAATRNRAAALGAAGYLVKGTVGPKDLLWNVERHAAPRGA